MIWLDIIVTSVMGVVLVYAFLSLTFLEYFKGISVSKCGRS